MLARIRKFHIILFVSPIFYLLTSSCSDRSDLVTPKEETSFELRVTFLPVEVKSTNGKVNLLYGVEVPNFEKEGYTLKDFQVLNAATGNILCSIKDTTKYLLLHKASEKSIPGEDSFTPKAEHSTYRITIGLVLEPAQVPQKIKHKLILVKDAKEKIIEGTETTVTKGQIHVLASPLKGERLVSGATTSLESNHHPGIQLTYKGKTTVIERFCVDWLKVDENGNYFTGDIKVNENWFVYGQNVYSVADGYVISSQDGLPDQIPFEKNDTNIYDATGNNVVILISGGYAVYCHFKPGSVTVKAGQKITKGQLIGKVGNSGDSDAPHLHFGLHSEFPYYISESIPYYIASLEKIGSLGKLGGAYIKLASPELHTNELMENYGVYNIK